MKWKKEIDEMVQNAACGFSSSRMLDGKYLVHLTPSGMPDCNMYQVRIEANGFSHATWAKSINDARALLEEMIKVYTGETND